MSYFEMLMVILLLSIYVVLPLGATPGPMDDVIVMFIGVTELKRMIDEK